MRLKRLELQGFKSFLDRTILSFEPGITGVVGPNGCGKSNIVDAIMWVMGEQSPKHLRGESMTDIIFNGSDTRAPTSMAEVSLIMDRQGVALAPQFAMFEKGEEISITRRIYRDGTGEFFINKVNCRLKDIHELFMDTGVGRRAYSIIEQGQIDRMINVKPEDRRALFEEVAGITKYKAKRKEAEKKLELTRGNILRIQDIITELEKQIRSLKIQATRARKYKEIKTELETADLFLLGQQLTIHREVINALIEDRNNFINQRSEAEAKFSEVDVEVTQLEIRRIDEEKKVQELSDRERDVLLAVQKLEARVSVLEERKKHLSASLDTLTAEEAAKTTAKQNLESEAETTAKQREELEARVTEMDTQVGEFEQALEEAQALKQECQSREKELQRRISQLSDNDLRLGTQIDNAEARRTEVTDLQSQVAEKTLDAQSVVTTLKDSLKAVEEKIQDCQARNQEAEKNTSELHQECQMTSRQLSETEDQLFQKREQVQSKRSRLESLVELQNNLEGYSSTAKEIFTELKELGIPVVPFAELIQPEAELEDHMELLLGDQMNLLVVPTREEAEKLARMIEERNLERVAVTSQEWVGDQPETLNLLNASPLLSRVKVREGYQTIAQRFLGKVYLCQDKDTVLSLSREHQRQTFLSPGSQIIAHGEDVLSSGTTEIRMGVFARRREIEELETLCQAMQLEVDEVNALREQLLAKLEEQERLRTEWKEKLSAIHIESVEHRKERERGQSDLMRAERDVTHLLDENQRLSRNREELESKIAGWTEELSSIRDEKATAMVEIEQVRSEIQQSVEKFDHVMASINDLKIERSAIGERFNAIEYQLDKLRQDINSHEQRLMAIASQRESDSHELGRIDEEVASIVEESKDLVAERDQLIVSISDAKAAFQQTCTQLDDMRRAKDEWQDKKSEIVERLQEVELKLAHEESELQRIRNVSEERYHREVEAIGREAKLSLEQLPMLGEKLEVTWDLLLADEQNTMLHEHVKSMREKLERYGEVNLTAIQEFDEVQKRFDFLMNQKNDLENSIKTLEEAIIKIDESTKIRFEDTFRAVNEKFKEIFPILFNGGKAELSLTNPENMLESGVDVMAQPPGKRFQSITLMSGGEKALTAVSLVLAIFARKPSPFCLLDEVDAPLDDANVSRFNTVIRKMAEKTQFILITHNKKTMEIAEALYGVTMERAGVSKMTSVQMH